MSLSPFTIVTKSYAADRDMCASLCRSVDRHMPDVRHVLVIDRCDLPLFRDLATRRREIVLSEDLLPELRQISLLGRRLWLTPYSWPLRGWIQQQFCKMAAVAALQDDVVLIVDSDTEFLRPVPPGRLTRDGRIRLYRVPGPVASDRHLRWHRTASRVLNLAHDGYFGVDYIGPSVTWRPSILRRMIAAIERRTGLPWRAALANEIRFSEYVLYGVFVEFYESAARDEVFFDDQDLCHCCWHYDLSTEAGAAAFVEGFDDRRFAVLLQSNLGLDPARRERLLAGVRGRAQADADAKG